LGPVVVENSLRVAAELLVLLGRHLREPGLPRRCDDELGPVARAASIAQRTAVRPPTEPSVQLLTACTPTTVIASACKFLNCARDS